MTYSNWMYVSQIARKVGIPTRECRDRLRDYANSFDDLEGVLRLKKGETQYYFGDVCEKYLKSCKVVKKKADKKKSLAGRVARFKK